MEVERRSSSSASSSPEFEFWMVRNPSCPPPDLITADELFVDGILLPLHLLSLPRSSDPTAPPPMPSPTAHPALPPPSSILCSSSSAAPTSVSRRWKDLFKVAVGDKKAEDHKEKEKKKQKDPKSAAELNINLNIWPFSRSRSAGNSAATRHRSTIAGRKVSSAPCSRSNSRGDSAGGSGGGWRCPASPGRGGVHLGRSSPVWQPRRSGMGPIEKPRKPVPVAVAPAAGGGVRVLNRNVNSCTGHRNQIGAGGDDSNGVTSGARIVEGSGNNGSLFSFRGLFSKKVY